MAFRKPTHLASVFLALVALLSCEAEKVEQPPPPIRPVRYREVYGVGGTRVRAFTGVAKAGVESKLSFKVPGTIQTLNVKVGDLVQPGQLVAAIDPRDYELLVEETEASLAQARAQAVKAEADFKRIRGLFERDNASQADYDAARAAQDSARAQVRSIDKKLESAELQLSYTRLESQLAGAVAEVPVGINENVQAGQPLLTLLSGQNPEVEVGIPEVLITEIRDGASATIVFDALPGREFHGRVTELAVTVTQGLSTYPVTVQLNQTWEQLTRGRLSEVRPGMSAEVSFRFGSGDAPVRWILPPHAVREDREGRFVFVVKPSEAGFGAIERRGVAVGEFVREGLEITKGLQDGEFVVTAGAGRITDGQQVKLSKENEG